MSEVPTEPAGSPPDTRVERAFADWRHGDASGFAVVVSMLRTYGTLIRDLEAALRPVNLNVSRLEVLLILAHVDGKLPIMQLRDLLLIHGSSATYLVDRLVEEGWLTRDTDPNDRRVSLVSLTPAGREMVDAGAQALDDAGFGPVARLAEDHRRSLLDILATMRGVSPPRLAGP